MKRFSRCMLIGLLFSLLTGCGYNTMQANEEAVIAAWGDVEASYQRRADLIPNLVEVVKGYAKHEAETLQGGDRGAGKGRFRPGVQGVDQRSPGLRQVPAGPGSSSPAPCPGSWLLSKNTLT